MEELEFEPKNVKIGDYTSPADGPLHVSKDGFKFSIDGKVKFSLKIPITDITKCLAHFACKKPPNFQYQRQVIHTDTDVICLEVNQNCSKGITKELNSALSVARSGVRVQLIPDGSRIATKYIVFSVGRAEENTVDIFKEIFSPPGQAVTNRFRELSTTGLNLILQDFGLAVQQKKPATLVHTNNSSTPGNVSNMKLLCETTIKPAPTPPVLTKQVTPGHSRSSSVATAKTTVVANSNPVAKDANRKRWNSSSSRDSSWKNRCRADDPRAISSLLGHKTLNVSVTRLSITPGQLEKLTRKRLSDDDTRTSTPSKRANISAGPEASHSGAAIRSDEQMIRSRSKESSSARLADGAAASNQQPLVIVRMEPAAAVASLSATTRSSPAAVPSSSRSVAPTPKPSPPPEELDPIVVLDAGAFSVGPYKGIGLSSMELSSKELKLHFSNQTPALKTLGGAMCIRAENVLHVLAHVSPLHTSVAFLYFTPPFAAVLCAYLQAHADEFATYHRKDDAFNSYGVLAVVLQPVPNTKCAKLKKVCRKLALDRNHDGTLLQEIDAEGAGKFLKVCFSSKLHDALATTDQKVTHTACIKEDKDDVICESATPETVPPLAANGKSAGGELGGPHVVAPVPTGVPVQNRVTNSPQLPVFPAAGSSSTVHGVHPPAGGAGVAVLQTIVPVSANLVPVASSATPLHGVNLPQPRCSPAVQSRPVPVQASGMDSGFPSTGEGRSGLVATAASLQGQPPSDVIPSTNGAAPYAIQPLVIAPETDDVLVTSHEHAKTVDVIGQRTTEPVRLSLRCPFGLKGMEKVYQNIHCKHNYDYTSAVDALMRSNGSPVRCAAIGCQNAKPITMDDLVPNAELQKLVDAGKS